MRSPKKPKTNATTRIEQASKLGPASLQKARAMLASATVEAARLPELLEQKAAQVARWEMLVKRKASSDEKARLALAVNEIVVSMHFWDRYLEVLELLHKKQERLAGEKIKELTAVTGTPNIKLPVGSWELLEEKSLKQALQMTPLEQVRKARDLLSMDARVKHKIIKRIKTANHAILD